MTRLSRLHTQEALAVAAVALFLTLGGFTFGFVMGLTVPRNYKCPVVPGAKVLTTIDRKDGQLCTYAHEYGKATVQVKL